MRRHGIPVLVVLAVLAGCSNKSRKTSAVASSATTSAATTPAATTSSTPAGTSSASSVAPNQVLPGATTPATQPVPGTTAATSPSRFLYSANYGEATIGRYRIDPATGVPSLLGTLALADVPLGLVAHPSSKFLYAIERGEVTPLAIEASGNLKPIGAPVVLTGDYPMAAAVTANGSFLVVTYYGGSLGGSVRTFAIGATGALTALDRVALGASAYPTDVVVDPANRFAFVVDSIGETINVLSLAPVTGKLTPVGAPFASKDVSALALDASGSFLAVMTSASPGSVQVHAVAANGTLAPRGTPVPTGPHSPVAITLAPDGRTFYVITANSTLMALVLDAQGNLATSAFTQVPAYGFPSGLAVDASGKFLYTANFAGDDLSVVTVAPGGLSAGANVKVVPATPGVAAQPSWVVTVR